jgi:hypothetical protein
MGRKNQFNSNKMKKITIPFAAALFALLMLTSCSDSSDNQKVGETAATSADPNQSVSDVTSPTTPAPSTAIDTVVGIEGSEKAKFDVNTSTFYYAAGKVKIKGTDTGETIEVNGTTASGKEADFFSGVYKNFLLIDNGTAPNGRMLKIWSIAEKKLVFNMAYEGNLSIKDDKLNFIVPLDLKKNKLPKPVNCPDEASWKKDGLAVGYGIPSAFDFASKTVSVTGDATCFAIQ